MNVANIEDLLRDSGGAAAPDSVLLTGLIRRSASAEHFLLQRHGHSRHQTARLRKADVIGDPLHVPAAELPLAELGNPLYAVRIIKGAPATVYTSRPHRVGDEPRLPAVLDDYRRSGASRDSGPAMPLERILHASEGASTEGYGVFPGVVLAGHGEDEIRLQVDPPNHTDFAIIKRADIVDPNAIAEVPADALPLSRAGFPIYLVKVRLGAVIQAISGVHVSVDRQPPEPCGCGGCTTSPDPSRGGLLSKTFPDHDSEKGVIHRAWGDVCWEGVKRRPDNGKLDFFCEVEGAACFDWFSSGKCTTQSHWLWGQRCNCA